MNQHTNDPFGNEASRSHDAIPIEQSIGEPVPTPSENPAEANDLRDLAGQTTPAGTANEEAPRPTRRPRSARPTGAREAAADVREVQSAPQPTVESLHDLEGQGFTEDEALRLIAIRGRLGHSAEAVEAEATLRRLSFTRWLVEHGKLDEWSA